MTLITSISGIRGTIGGVSGENLTPLDIIKFSTAYALFIKQNKEKKCKIVCGRDGRISGKMVSSLAINTLMAMGIDVYDIGLTTTPTVEVAVCELGADGGIIFTASHNPEQWNALKLLNSDGEFLNAAEGQKILDTANNGNFNYADVKNIGDLFDASNMNNVHLEKVLKMPAVNAKAIEAMNFKIVVDGINSTGGTMMPQLLEMLGLKKENIIVINGIPNGKFAHNPEPLAEHLTEIIKVVKENKADLGIVVDPDVDRLAFVNEDGSLFGEEYTLVAVADYILSINPGNTVSNLSSTRALKDVTQKYGKTYTASGVGEVNVVEAMKKTKAVIGGEGNGGVIYPDLHYGRDAIAGTALFLTHLAKSKCKMTELRKKYPDYFVSKNKVDLRNDFNFEEVKQKLIIDFANNEVNTTDGIRIDFPQGWVHLRKSNTEPIIRIYAEAIDEENANSLANKIIKYLK